MTDAIGHECGLGLIRLRKPLSWYQQNYGSTLWGLGRMYLLMEKMHNRGQDGAGLAVIKADVKPGMPYIHRIRNNQQNPWINLNKEIQQEYAQLKKMHGADLDQPEYMTQYYPWAAEVMMAHLRYGTHGGNSIDYCHPFIRHSNWKCRTLAMAGNFNLTNVDELFTRLLNMGQHPPYMADTVTVMERVGHFLEEETDRLRHSITPEGRPTRETFTQIENQMNLQEVLRKSAVRWDGGYAMGGMVGTGDAFVARDPHGIRPAFYYIHEDYVVVASERPAIATVFGLAPEEVSELPPGNMIWIHADGRAEILPFCTPGEVTRCSFERIYFSRGNDPDIYRERQALGKHIVPQLMQSIQGDMENTVFSYVPNTSETAFLGMMKGLEDYLCESKTTEIMQAPEQLTREQVQKILSVRPRVEKVIIKDVKLRTFITDDANRDEMVAHVYDVTYGCLRPGIDTLVCIDDSIVRGTTIKKSILAMLAKLEPRKIVMVSSAPQIRYPDCYGIDMSEIGKFVAFQAAISLLKKSGQEHKLHEIYAECKALEAESSLHTRNLVKQIYKPFSVQEISAEIALLLTPPGYTSGFEVLFPNLEDLRNAVPDHTGDWYFSGNYPTPGGNKVVNKAFMQFMTGQGGRAY